MPNYFPILFLAPLAYFLLRICVAIILIYLGRSNITHRKSSVSNTTFSQTALATFGIIEIALGVFFFVGFSTQIAALALMAVTLIHLIRPHMLRHTMTPSRIFFVLLFFVSVSLFITGAGPFAYDLPI